MKKALSLFLVALFLLSAVVFSFAGCGLLKSMTPDEAKETLEGAGYTVTVMSGSEFADSDQNTFAIFASDLDSYLYAVKGNDVIYMYFFTDTDTASRNYDFMIAPGDLYGGQSNNVVYFATKQARKDAKV